MVIAGKDKGRAGKVLRALPRTTRVIVEGVNIQKRHQKTKRDTKQGGGIVDVAAPIHASNVQLVDPKDSRPTRLGVEKDDAGKRVRVTKRSGTKLK